MSLYCKKVSKALYKKPLQSYEAPPIKWHHSVLQAAMTQHRQTCHALTPAKQADSQFTYSAGMKDWVDLVLGGWLNTKRETIKHQSNNDPTGNRTRNLSIASLTPYHYTTKLSIPVTGRRFIRDGTSLNTLCSHVERLGIWHYTEVSTSFWCRVACSKQCRITVRHQRINAA